MTEHMGKSKIDPSIVEFKMEMLNTEPGERNLTCAIMQKDPPMLQRIFTSVFECMSPDVDRITHFNEFHSACMAKRAREEEAAYDKEHAAAKKS